MPATPGTESAIAIVGLSCRFPGDASNPAKFWELLKNGRKGWSETTDRYNADAFYHPKSGSRQNVIPTKGGYFIEQDPYVFDAAFFNITATEALALDPRQRITLEVAYEALENAGMPLQKVSGTQTACFMGNSISDYRDSVARDFQNYPKYQALGSNDEMIANRVSHFLNIHGPSATVQSACSSSLVATHIACQSLRSGESEMALCGGVALTLGVEGTMHLQNVGFLNPKGQSRSFDADAGGYGRGEGCGVLVLKRLETAIRDGDTIRAVISGSGSNSDGWTQGLTMPSEEAQVGLIKYVYESNGLDFGSTQYVEAHGTGTKVGDPIEARAIHRTIGQGDSGHRTLYMGSLKPNIGHLEAAAGVASIIKGVLALEHGLIPPSLNFTKANPAIPLDEWKMVIPTKLTPWPATHTKRMSISGFGAGGTNGHIVLDGYYISAALTHVTGSRTGGQRLFGLSSQDKAGFKRVAEALARHLDGLGAAASNPTYLANLAHTLAKARSGLRWKITVLAENVTELRERLAETTGENATRTPSSAPRLHFVFTGQGAQWARMGLEMMDRPVFSASVAKSAKFLKMMGCEWDPVTELSKAPKDSRLSAPEISQPICSVLQIALVDELRSWGVSPQKVVGHSSGELAAAYTAGALSHYDALAGAYFRGQASSTPDMKQRNGGMMAVACTEEDAQKLMNATKLQATIACVNAPSNITISGDAVTLEALRVKFDEQGVFARRLKVEVAYHSPHMHDCSMEYYSAIADIGQTEIDGTRGITMVSSVTGTEADLGGFGPYYWVQNLISPVRFSDAVKEMVSPAAASKTAGIDLLVEIGPHSTLGGPIEQILSAHGVKNVNYTSMLVRGQSALDTSIKLASDLFCQGVPVDISKFNGDLHCRLLTDLPPYAWNHSQKFRADGRIQREQYAQRFPTRSLLGSMMPTMDEKERVWRSFIRLADEPWLRGHVIASKVLFPGAGMVSIALEAAQQLVDDRKTARSFKFRDISFVAAMILPEDEAAEVTVHMRPHMLATGGSTPTTWWEFAVSSAIGPLGQVRTNCRGLISIVYEEHRSVHMIQEDDSSEAIRIADYRRVLDECPATCSKEAFYNSFVKCGMDYAVPFQGVKQCHPGPGKTCFEVEVANIGETFTEGKLDRHFLIDAATLDAAWHGTMGGASHNGSLGFAQPMVPVSIAELEIFARMPGEVGHLMPVVCRSRVYGFNEFTADLSMFDKDMSGVVMSVTDFRMSPVENEIEANTSTSAVDPADIVSELHWNFAMDLLEPIEVGRAISTLAGETPEARLVELVRMVIHQRPAVKVIELVGSLEDIHGATMSRLPSGSILPTQVRYAVVEVDAGDGFRDALDANLFGQPFALGHVDSPLPPDTASAELMVISQKACNISGGGLDGMLWRLIHMATPGAALAIAGLSTDSAVEEQVSSLLKANEYSLVCRTEAGAGSIHLYKHISSNRTEKPEELTNGAYEEITILEPPVLSSKSQSFSSRLSSTLKDQGYSVQIWSGLLETNVADDKICISLLELEKPILEGLSEPEFLRMRHLLVSCRRLLWITSGDDPALGMVDGLLRCANIEVAGGRFQVLHLSSEGQQQGPSLISRVLKAPEAIKDNEFREQSGLLQVSRLYTSPNEIQHVRNHLEDSTRVMSLDDTSDTLRLTIGKPGLLDSLRFERDEHEVLLLAADEVEIQVKATGLNFKDIMASMGLIPTVGLGIDASGIILRVGSRAAQKFKPGDRVSALSVGGTHALKTRCDYRAIAIMPDTMSFEEGAAVPTVHATAYHAIVNLARLRRGQSILIHAAAGGVGQAALQLAQHLGLIAYVTVGTEDKRRFVMEQYGVRDDQIFNSRDTSFAGAIDRMTGGRGVDCVLNSLSGELLRVSWNCLATFGSFIEIGLRDIVDNMRLDMRPFGKSASFTFFDIPTLILNDPEVLGNALEEIFKLMHDKTLDVPHPMTVYPIREAEEAFRVMQQGKHRGKLVLSFNGDDKTHAPVLCKAKDSLRLSPDATYMLIGGLGGLGRSLAQEFVASGARHIAFISRSGDSKPEARAIIDELEATGTQVKVFRGDVARRESFLAAMDQCSKQLPPVKGVVQMAMVLRDALVENMTYEEWTTPIRPKVQGTRNVHEYFNHERPLDFMIFCSSIAGLCANPGQAAYAAGNTYEDALAHYRRANGLKAVSINLGIMLDVGVIAETGQHSFGAWQDVLGIREQPFRALMKSVINGQQSKRARADDCPAQLGIGLGHADIIATHRLTNPRWFDDARAGPLTVRSAIDSLSTANNNPAAASLSLRLIEAGNDQDLGAATQIITVALVAKLAEILRMPPSEIDANRPMYSYGVDSLVALEVRNWITRELKANMALLDILAAVPMEKFAAQIVQKSAFLTK